MENVQKIYFAIYNYFWLSLFLLSCFGTGSLFLLRTADFQKISHPLYESITISVGLGILIIVLFVLGIAGFLKAPIIAMIVLAMAAYGIVRLVKWKYSDSRDNQGRSGRFISFLLNHWFFPAAVMVLAIPLLVSPLQLPYKWDELMYHLPHARFWADHGSLQVNPWVRFPLFPMNFELLYAAALVFKNDIFPHLIHSLAGWLVVAGLYLGSSKFFDRRVGFLAAIIFLLSVHQQFRTAYIDLGITFFIFNAFLCLALWWDRSEEIFLYLSIFFMALAVGTKYQGFIYVPIFGIFILLKERRVSLILKLSVLFIILGGYWYLRSYIISGDPIHPLGAKYFGYFLWDKGDLEYLYKDAVNRIEMPPVHLIIAAAGVFFLRGSSKIYKGMFCLAAYAVLVWFYLGYYVERYLMPAYPFLSLLAAFSIIRIVDLTGITSRFKSLVNRFSYRRLQLIQILVIILLIAAGCATAAKDWKRIMVSDQDRQAYLSNRFGSYSILRSIPNDGSYRVYQLYFEEEIYYSPVPIAGDHFGPARYRTVIKMIQQDDANTLANHLHSLGLNCILLNKKRPPYKDFQFGPQCKKYFQLIRSNEFAELYQVKDSGKATLME